MAKNKSKYRDVESMTDEEFEALTREIAGPHVEFHEPPSTLATQRDMITLLQVEVIILLPFTMMRIIIPALARRHGTLISSSILLMERESTSIME